MAASIYDDHGISLEHPADWPIEVDDGPDGRVSITTQSPGGLAFAIITVDEGRPDPAAMADEALDAMRAEYPDLDASPAVEAVGGHKAVGHDVEFLALDLVNSCSIRCWQTPHRTIFVMGQWSDLDEDDPEGHIRAIRASIEETDG